LSSKHQATFPVEVLRAAGIEPGDELRFVAEGPGTMRVERAIDPLDELAGALTGRFPSGFLDEMRAEWDSPSWTPAS
jgi:bifunctional DNA-binding transcriptional regulator/antitoxin component of YhaV-PrlF toxin-antitoxin module